MQRWIVAGLVFVVLLMGGGYFAYRTYQQNRTTRIWLPLPMSEVAVEQRRETTTLLKKRLSDPLLMEVVCKDSGYAKTMGFASDEEGSKDLLKRFFCEIGTTPDGKLPAINVGFSCKVKDFSKMGPVTNRLRKDILRILGLPEPVEPF
ncbi:MAG: hypothetical protein K9N23_08035 [Akkermansiaceae bacterium]|nr:hypothetical protein [Akkermansiaceae bacterium]MCF7731622.1 hypothetical protein [Akkermansiaceae bacterium]